MSLLGSVAVLRRPTRFSGFVCVELKDFDATIVGGRSCPPPDSLVELRDADPPQPGAGDDVGVSFGRVRQDGTVTPRKVDGFPGFTLVALVADCFRRSSRIEPVLRCPVAKLNRESERQWVAFRYPNATSLSDELRATTQPGPLANIDPRRLILQARARIEVLAGSPSILTTPVER